MKLWAKIAVGVVGLIVLAAGSAAAFVSVKWDENYDTVEGPDLNASTDSAVIARGEYLVRGPAHCGNCHAGVQDLARVDSGKQVPLQGGMPFVLGPLGKLTPANLTPDSATGIGGVPDRQLFRMLRHSIKRDGTASLGPIMPFHMMADEDLVAVVSYLRTQPAVRNEVPPAQYTAMGKAIRSLMPAFKPRVGHSAPEYAPAEAATRERGEYLARYVANCVGCHTQFDLATGSPIGPEFAGGMVFNPEPGMPGYEEGLSFRTVNLTPDSATGVLAKFGTKDSWMQRFRAGRAYQGSPMPWGPFSRMSDADIEALWIFFNGLAPVRNDVSPTVFRDTAQAK